VVAETDVEWLKFTGRMEARFADEKVSAVFEPGEHVAGEDFDFLVAQVHEKPIGEDDVEFLLGRELQLGDIGTQKVHVSVVAVALAILLHVIGHEIDRRQVFGVLRQMFRKPPEYKTKMFLKYHERN
jgi:hypothetical protein